MESKHLYIGVGGNSIKHVVTDKESNFYKKGSEPTPYEEIERYLDMLEGTYRRLEGDAAGAAISAPGTIDSERGICMMGENLTHVEQFPLTRRLGERCQVPVTITDNTKCAALAGVSRGVLKGCQDVAALVSGTGIEGAFIKGGKVHTGKHFVVGEFSFTTMEQERDLEDNTWVKQNDNERLTTMAARAKRTSSEGVAGFGVSRWVKDGDGLVWKASDKFTRDIAFMTMNFQVILNPELFVIEGGINKQLPLLTYTRKNLEHCESIFPYRVSKAWVTTYQHSNDAGLVGALQHYLEREQKYR